MHHRRLLTALATSLALAAPAAAQIEYSTPGRPYVQNFDHPDAADAGILSWVDNSTFGGWFAAYYDGLRGTFSPVDNIVATSGAGRLEHAFYLYRSDPVRAAGSARANPPPRPDAALGTQPSDTRCPGVGSGGIFYGVALVNRSGVTLETLRLSYRVELWRLAFTPAKQSTLTASYRVGGDSLTSGNWTLIPGAVYTTPHAGEGEGSNARSLDGNAPENVTPFPDLVVGNLALAPGQTLWIRWFDVNNRLADHGIGLDDVSITLLP
jgi:hypothetical protein